MGRLAGHPKTALALAGITVRCGGGEGDGAHGQGANATTDAVHFFLAQFTRILTAQYSLIVLHSYFSFRVCGADVLPQLCCRDRLRPRQRSAGLRVGSFVTTQAGHRNNGADGERA